MPMFGGNRIAFRPVQSLLAAYGFWTIFPAGFTPIPYRVITFGAGGIQIRFPVFVFGSLLRRSLQFFGGCLVAAPV